MSTFQNMNDDNKKTMPKLKIFLIILAAISFVIIVYATNKSISLPGKLGVTISGSTYEKHSDSAGIIIDKNSTRLIFLDGNERCAHVIRQGNFSDAVYYSACAVNDEAIWVAEYSQYDNSPYIDTESIVKYSLSGEKLGAVAQIKHDLYGTRTLDPFIDDLYVADNKGYAIGEDALAGKLIRFEFPADPDPDYVPDIKYSSPEEKEMIIDVSYALSDSHILIAKNSSNDFQICEFNEYFSDFYSSELRKINKFTGEEAENTVGEAYDFIAPDTINVSENRPHEGLFIPYSFGCAALNLIIWLAGLYLILLLVILFAGYIAGVLRRKEYHRIKTILFNCLIVLLCGYIVYFYNSEMNKNVSNAYYKSLKGYALTFKDNNNELIKEAIDEYDETGSLNYNLQCNLTNKLESNTADLADVGSSVIFRLIALKDGKLDIVADSYGSTAIGEDSRIDSGLFLAKDGSSGEKNSVNEEIQEDIYNVPSYVSNIFMTETDLWYGRFLLCAVPYYDIDKGVTGAVACYMDMLDYNYSRAIDCIQIFISLLTVLMTAGFVVKEANAAANGFAKRERLRKEGYKYPEYALARPCMLITAAAYEVNTTLIAIIFSEMSEGSIFEKSAFLLALPIALFNFGHAAGTPLLKIFTKRFSGKKTVLIFSFGAMLGYIACFFAVKNSQILLFTVLIFLVNAMLCVPYLFSRSLAFYAENDSERTDTNRDISMSHLTATSLATVFAGLIADRYGNAYIQLLGAAAVFILLVFVVIFIPDHNPSEANEASQGNESINEKEEKHGAGAFARDVLVIALILLVIVPDSIGGGFSSYLFPLFASDSGMSKSTIGNIVTFAGAVSFYMAPVISKIEKKSGNAIFIAAVELIRFTAFAMFIISPSIVWAVIALASNVVSAKSISPAISSFWQKRAIELDVNKESAQLEIQTAYSVTDTLKSPILGAVLGAVGNVMTSITLGIYGLICTLGFFLTVKKKKQDNPSEVTNADGKEALS